jgi:hypothetical protein
LEVPAEERELVGHLASARVATELNWRVITRNAVDFVEERFRLAQEGDHIR